MTAIVRMLPEAMLLSAVIGLSHLLALVFRNPFRPAWLDRNWIGTGATLGIVAALSLGIPLVVAGGLEAGLRPEFAIAAAVAIALGANYAFWRGFEIGNRLHRADAGQSPFYPLPWTGAVVRGWHRRFGGGAST